MKQAREILNEASKAYRTAVEVAEEAAVLARVAVRKCEAAATMEDLPSLKGDWKVLAGKQRRLVNLIQEFLDNGG